MSSRAPFPPRTSWEALLSRALEEDLGPGDLTSNAVLSASARIECALEARQDVILCGLEIAEAAFRALDPDVRFQTDAVDGDRIEAGTIAATVAGAARAVLAAERTALNFLQRLSGVATLTRRFVDAVGDTGVAIVDTRKTIPGWRVLDKYAVRTGGGVNHRAGLYDAILIKDNHIAAAGGVRPAIETARHGAPPHIWLQVEVESEEQAEEAVKAGADSLLLDNRSVDELRSLARRFGDRVVLEASGGIRLENIAAVAATGVHRISVGALTHSAPAADLALEVLSLGEVA